MMPNNIQAAGAPDGLCHIYPVFVSHLPVSPDLSAGNAEKNTEKKAPLSDGIGNLFNPV